MNTMNIQSMNFGSKVPKSNIRIEGKVNNYVTEMLDKCSHTIDNVAKAHSKNVVIAQKGDSLLVNSGAVTTHFNMKEMNSGKDFLTGILNNITANSEVGIGKSLNKFI